MRWLFQPIPTKRRCEYKGPMLCVHDVYLGCCYEVHGSADWSTLLSVTASGTSATPRTLNYNADVSALTTTGTIAIPTPTQIKFMISRWFHVLHKSEEARSARMSRSSSSFTHVKDKDVYWGSFILFILNSEGEAGGNTKTARALMIYKGSHVKEM